MNTPCAAVWEFWVDVFVAAETEPKRVNGDARLVSGGEEVVLPFTIDVVVAKIPRNSSVVMDNNSDGAVGWGSNTPRRLEPQARNSMRYTG